MRTRMSLLILLVVVFQLVIYSVVLIYGGEFRNLREYSYGTFVEKTESSGIYIQSFLREKPVIVQEYAGQLNSMVAGILAEREAAIGDLKQDRELGQSILRSSVEIVSSLMRSSMANDVYLILDTGDLYAGEDGGPARAALYLRDTDPNQSVEDGEPLMVLGFDSIARELGLTRHSDWSEYFEPDPRDASNFEFYYTTLQTARESGGTARDDLGYWSRFSKVSFAVTPSMKYSLPLIAGDGTVYGVLGIGLTKNAVFDNIPSRDLLSENSCYVLAYSEHEGSFEILTYAGAGYAPLLGSANILQISGEVSEGVCSFKRAADAELLGSVRYMEMYGQNSPYAGERWALLSVAARSGVLYPLLFLERMMIVSVFLSLIGAALIALPGCSVVIRPLSNLRSLMKTKRNYNEVIRFQPSNVYEIDEITDAITQLQINVRGFSSQVSKMISIADVGLGTFMCDRTDDSVFVGQSLIKILRLNLPRGEDIVMSRRDFLDSIGNPEIQSLIAAGLGMASGETRTDISEVHRVTRMTGETLWMRLGFTYSPNTAIGIVQDITEAMEEKSRIEHERDHDALTGLLTRQAYYRRIEEVFRDRSKLRITAFVMVDLDNLKHVNDTYGHSFGDDYIKTAAAALRKFEDHGGIVARLSGDEFNICLPGFSSKDEVRKIIEDVRTVMLQSSCLLADGTHFKVSACMGVSWYPDDAESRELLMKYADFAMYTVKHSVKGGIAEFDINSYATDSARLTDLEELDRIIEESGVRYAFQSIVSVITGEIYGYEALMRVQSEIFQSPLELLNIAKSSGKLHEIERLTWTKALADFQALVDAGRVNKDARLFVNSIANHKLEDEVVAGLENAYPQLLDQVVVEIVESENADEESIAHKEKVMERWGAQMALDDYGTGYNSQYALLSLRPDIIKIDRSIISACDQDSDRRMIIENVVKLARTRGIHVLAEGVETEEEVKTVIASGVEFLQGFYLARPVFEPGPIDPEVIDTIKAAHILFKKEKSKEESL